MSRLQGVALCLLVGISEVLASGNDDAAVGLLATVLVILAGVIAFLLVVFICPMKVCRRPESTEKSDDGVSLPGGSPRGMWVTRILQITPSSRPEADGVGALCQGREVMMIRPGSPAEAGGMEAGMKLWSVNGERLYDSITSEEVQTIFRRAAQGRRTFDVVIREKVVRDDAPRHTDVSSAPRNVDDWCVEEHRLQASATAETAELQPGQRCEVRSFEDRPWLPATVDRFDRGILWACPDGWTKNSQWRYWRELRTSRTQHVSERVPARARGGDMEELPHDQASERVPARARRGDMEEQSYLSKRESGQIMRRLATPPELERPGEKHAVPPGQTLAPVYVKSQGLVPTDRSGLIGTGSPASERSIAEIRMLQSPNHADPPPPPPLEAGTQIEALFHGQWFDAMILAIDTDVGTGEQTYEVDWQDGTGTAGLTREEIRHRPYQTNPRAAVSLIDQKWRVGDKVRALYHGVWYNATVINLVDGSYDVRFPDGSIACAVSANDLRAPKN